MNRTRLPKEVLLPDGARRNMQVTKGDRVYKFLGLVITNSLSWKDHIT
jgi:hypothetical protein